MRSVPVTITLACLFVLFSAQLLTAGEINHHEQKVDPAVPGICVTCHEVKSGHSHPVDIPYPPANAKVKYAPAADVQAAGLALPKGRIACITCHNLQNQGKKHLAVTMDGSKLCSTCHVNY
jgi:hypothetical protein